MPDKNGAGRAHSRETPHCRVSYQGLVASGLLRVDCLRSRGDRPPGTQISTPLRPPRIFPELRRPRARQLRLLSLTGNSIAATTLSEPKRSRPTRVALVDGKHLVTVCRIKVLWRLRCCALPVCGLWEERELQNAIANNARIVRGLTPNSVLRQRARQP